MKRAIWNFFVLALVAGATFADSETTVTSFTTAEGTMAVVAEYTTTAAVAESTTTAAVAESTTTAAVVESTTTAAVVESTTTAAVVESTTTAAVVESTTTAAVADSTTTAAVADSTTTAAAAEFTTTAAVAESSTTASVVAESTTPTFTETRAVETTTHAESTTIDPRVTDSTRPPQYKVCFTPDCVKAAESISSKIDESVAPCDDFYKFACGKYMKETQIPDDKTVVDTFSSVRDQLQDQLNTVITSPVDDDDIEPFKMVKRIYSACMNKDLVEERGLSPIREIMDTMGGWPAVRGDSWDERAWSWQKAAVDCRKSGYSTDYIVDFSVGTDLKNSSTKIVDIDQPDLGLSQVFLLKGLENPVVSAYHKFQVDTAILHGADRERAEKEMREAFDFEVGLANISLPNEKRRNASALYNPLTVKQVLEKFPYNNWLQYINDILPDGIFLTEDETIIVYDIEFFEKLDSLLRATPKRAVANYVMWRVAAESTNFLTDKLRKRQLEYAGAIIGQQTEEPRWKECIDLATYNFEIASAALYVRKYFNQDSKAVALEMVNSIREVFEGTLKTIPWMDSQTREAALVKAKSIVAHIGFPDELMDDKKLEEYYKDVKVNEKKFLESVLSIKAFKADLDYKKLRKPVNKTDWETHSKAAVVNAAYSSIENSIRFPAGILQGQFFSASRPKFMNYGAIGVVIGHEITHGFDDQGRQFDSVGNLVDWWGKETSDAYLEKAKCIIDQYANYSDALTELNLNGINTQGENIADNGGAKAAYLAYRNYVNNNGVEPKLPGLNYSSAQLYWISSAQTWCAVFRPEAMKKRILTGVHSPNEFRVIGPHSNMKEFSEDFHCEIGTNMNPIKKCEVW